MEFIKNYKLIILIGLILLSLSIYHSEIFYFAIWFYVVFIKFILSQYVSGQLERVLKIGIWIFLSCLLALTFYVNHYLPHGQMYSSGEVVCRYDDRGPCGEKFEEDMRSLDIPDWAKFTRTVDSRLLLLALFFAGILISNKQRNI